MDIGELKHRIQFVSRSETVSPNGFKSTEWIESAKAWAKITSTKHSKGTLNEKSIEEVTILFVIRYRDVEQNWRIRYQGREYEIVTSQDEDFSRRFLSITAKEVK